MSSLLSAATPARFAQQVSLDAAKKEGKVFVYGTIIPQVMKLIEAGFEAKYGVNIEYWRGDATKVIDRVLTEWRAGKPGFDMVIGARGPLALGKADGVYAKFAPASAANFPEKFKDKDGQLTAWRITPVGILINTEQVKGNDVPKSLGRSLAPKWQGKISMPDPSRHASTAAFLRTCNKSKATNGSISCARWRNRSRSWWNPILRCPTPSSAVKRLWESPTFNMCRKPKGPSASRPLTRFLPIPATQDSVPKRPIPTRRRFLIDYLCSPEGQKKVAETHEFVVSPGVFPAIKGADRIVANLPLLEDPSARAIAKAAS